MNISEHPANRKCIHKCPPPPPPPHTTNKHVGKTALHKLPILRIHVAASLVYIHVELSGTQNDKSFLVVKVIHEHVHKLKYISEVGSAQGSFYI